MCLEAQTLLCIAKIEPEVAGASDQRVVYWSRMCMRREKPYCRRWAEAWMDAGAADKGRAKG